MRQLFIYFPSNAIVYFILQPGFVRKFLYLIIVPFLFTV